jgi:hypothetical protein
MQPSPSSPAHARLTRQLRRLRGLLRRYYVINGVNWLIATVSIAVALILLLWAYLGVPEPAVAALGAIAGAATLVVAIRHLVYPLTRRISDGDLVVVLERRFPQLADRLSAALQLRNYAGPARYSPVMIEALLRDADRAADELDVAAALRPNRLLPIGLVAVAASMALAATSYSVATREGDTRKGIVVVFPQPGDGGLSGETVRLPDDVTINFARVDADTVADTGGAIADDGGTARLDAALIVGEGSDVVVRAMPRTYDRSRDAFDIDDYATADLLVRGDGGGLTRYPMSVLGGGADGVYQYVLRAVSGPPRTIWVEWEGVRSPMSRLVPRSTPRIEDLSVTYRAPRHMRPRALPLDPDAERSPEVTITTAPDGGFELSIPTLGADGRPQVRDGELVREVKRFSDDAALEAEYPDLFARYVRERTDTRDTVTATEGTEAIFKLRVNRPIDPVRSRLEVFLTPSGNQTATTERIDLTPDPAVENGFTARITLDRRMRSYAFRLTDTQGLRRLAQRRSKIVVTPDQAPSAAFVDTGLPLREGSTERKATPTGVFPIVVEATDDFGLRSLKLLYSIGVSTDVAEMTPVPDFAKAVAGAGGLRDYPTALRLPFTIDLAKVLADIPPEGRTRITIMFRLVAEDIKVQDETDQGQLHVSSPFLLNVVSVNELRDEIRYLLSKVLMRRLERLETQQSALLFASQKFATATIRLGDGLPYREVFVLEEARPGDEDRRFTGRDALQMQDDIARSMLATAGQVDAIVRHYINNDLEEERREAPQENRLQNVKFLLALASLPKADALAVGDAVRAVNAAAESTRLAQLTEALIADLLARGGSDAVFGDSLPRMADVRASFNPAALGRAIQQVELTQPGAAREASLQIEQAVNPSTPPEEKAQAMRRSQAFQEQSLNALIQALDQLAQWEEFEEQRERLRRLRDRQADIESALRDALNPNRNDD